MERLTHKRNNGIKTGYWSPEKKEELVQRLATYEDTGLNPEQIRELDKLYAELCEELAKYRWIPVTERLPEDDNYILLSFANFSIPMIGRYEKDEEGGGAFYLGDCDEEDTCVKNDLFVNAWMPLPDPYKDKIVRGDADA